MDFETILPGLLAYLGVLTVVFWLALIVWAYRDMRARSRDPLAAIFVAVSVLLLNIPGVFIYLLLRPRETLAHAYERSLEEEALLQEIEEKPTCPGCGQRVKPDWQACPYCHTRLKKSCTVCNYPMQLSWELCPNCANVQPAYVPEDRAVTHSRHVQHSAPQPVEIPQIDEKWLAPDTRSRARNYSEQDTPGFVDDGY